eukprot:3174638-Pleurochrysis_carterae.AAC.2
MEGGIFDGMQDCEQLHWRASCRNGLGTLRICASNVGHHRALAQLIAVNTMVTSSQVETARSAFAFCAQANQ